LDRDSVVAFFATTAADGKMHQVEYFNLDAGRAESDLAAGKCDLIAVGRPFLANPDLVERWRTNAAVNAWDMSTFYTPGPKGYTDYPALKK
jgi:2,4-dienoyl-CoA reductase-like NADH-dependent reductase (Old Yellow Enzyme family)